MAAWEHDPAAAAQSGQSAAFDSALVRRLKSEADGDLDVSGTQLAAAALAAGLVDECHLYVAPVVVGGGKRRFPDDVPVELDLLEERRFSNGMVHLGYAVRRAEESERG